MSYPPLHLLAMDAVRRRRAQMTNGAGTVRPQWFLLYGESSKESVRNPDPARLKALYPPNDRFWADPFLWSDSGNRYVFFEEWINGDPHAHISAMRIGEGSTSEPIPVLEEPFHLSYPFLFASEGQLYMIPETSAAGAVRLYRCASFPDEWQFVHELIEDITAVDSTLVWSNGLWWMFLATREKLTGGFNALNVFSSDSPISTKWTPHARNPIVRSHRSGRPGGRMFEIDGQLIRPAQDSALRYGYGLQIHEIAVLSQDSFAQRRLVRLKPTWEAELLGTHHIDWHDGAMVMDAQRPWPTA